ncbi:hypothetical protein MTYP_02911 [Methylophilaceae bacterium]|nr:hypothetical protein MTYP_02911 [Methylophilaceae bacterium]
MAILQKEIRQQINQLAHHLAMLFEHVERKSLEVQLKKLADTGATLDELTQALNKIEITRKQHF